MRTLLGIIVGVFLAVGIAYVHDSSISDADRATQAIVNWDAFNASVRGVSTSLSALWDRLTDSAQNIGDSIKRKS